MPSRYYLKEKCLLDDFFNVCHCGYFWDGTEAVPYKDIKKGHFYEKNQESKSLMSVVVLPSDIEINETIVSNLLRDQFGLDVEKIKLLGEGWDNKVYLVNSEWIFRIPRRAEAEALIAKEMRILPRLKNRLSLTIPEPIYLGKPSKIFPRPFYGHKFIKGQSGCSVKLSDKEYERAAADLGTFLKGLHRIDIKELNISRADVMPCFDRTDFKKAQKTFSERLRQIEKHYDLKSFQEKFNKIGEDAEIYRPIKKPQTLLHGDMYHRHLIFNEQNHISGVIDWGDCTIADPVGDLGIIYQFFPKKAHRYFFDSYGPIDEAAQYYAKFIGLYFAIALLWFAHDRKDQDLIRTSFWTFNEI